MLNEYESQLVESVRLTSEAHISSSDCENCITSSMRRFGGLKAVLKRNEQRFEITRFWIDCERQSS